MAARIPTWAELKSVENVKLVQSTYIWLLIVPIVVKLLSKLDDTVTITVAGQPLTFDLVLPFSWQLFYMSALSFVLGNIVFLVFAPTIAKEYRNYGDFLAQGKLRDDISNYKSAEQAESDNNVNQLVQALPRFERNTMFAEKENANKSFYAMQQEKGDFWKVFNERIVTKKITRLWCSLLYFSGFVLFLGVMAQNIVWTLKEIIKLWRFL